MLGLSNIALANALADAANSVLTYPELRTNYLAGLKATLTKSDEDAAAALLDAAERMLGRPDLPRENREAVEEAVRDVTHDLSELDSEEDMLSADMDEVEQFNQDAPDEPHPHYEHCAPSPQQTEAERLKELFEAVELPEIPPNLNKKNVGEVLALIPKYEDNKYDNPVFAILLDHATGKQYGLRSGKTKQLTNHKKVPFLKGSVSQQAADGAGGIWTDLFFHVEGQAAAFMRKKEGIKKADLVMNASTPCKGLRGCLLNLPNMLEEGSTLKEYNKDANPFHFAGSADD